MAKSVTLRQGTAAEHAGFTGEMAEVTFDTTNNTVILHDGSTPGGIPMAKLSDVPVDLTDLTDVDGNINTATNPAPTGWAIDLSNVTYDNVSFGIGNLDGTPYQITFNADGTKMYQLGANTKRVIQYTLSTAFDLSTASTLSGTFDINASGQETSPSALFFSTDGTKMYICGFANATVYQYSLSVAFDISTAIYANQAYDISIQESYPTGIVFNPDGTKMYVCGFGDNIHEYGLTTAFDVSSASFNNVSFSVTNQATQGWGFRFNADGTKMYVVSSRADTVYQYSLATAFDLSSTSYDNVSISVNSQDNDPLDIAFNTDGTKMYVSGSQTDTIYQYSTGL